MLPLSVLVLKVNLGKISLIAFAVDIAFSLFLKCPIYSNQIPSVLMIEINVVFLVRFFNSVKRIFCLFVSVS